MKSWEEGRKELLKEFIRICGKIDENISLEITNSSTVLIEKEELRSLREISGHLKTLNQVNVRLQEENACLKEKMECCKSPAPTVDVLEKASLKTSVPRTVTATAIVSRESSAPNPVIKNEVSKETYQNIVVKYNSLYESYNLCKEARDVLAGRLRNSTTNELSWKDQAEKLRTDNDKKRIKIKTLEDKLRKSRRREDNNGDTSQDVQHFSERCQILNQTEMNMKFKESKYSQQCKSSSTTGYSDPLIPPNSAAVKISAEQEPSGSPSSPDETPIVDRSSGSVSKKRKKLRMNEELISQPRVKAGMTQSSPIGIAKFEFLQESVDTDNIGEKVDTPRKKRQHLELLRGNVKQTSNPPAEPINYHEHRNSSNQAPSPPSQRPKNILQLGNINKPILPKTYGHKPQSMTRGQTNDKIIGKRIEDGEFDSKPNDRSLETKFGKINNNLGHILERLSPAKIAVSSDKFAESAGNQLRQGRASGVPDLAQVVKNELSCASSRISTRNSEEPLCAYSKSSSGTSVVPQSPAQKNTQAPRRNTVNFAQLSKRNLESSAKGPRESSRPASRQSMAQRPVKSIHNIEYSEQPLRAQPIEKLNIRDFKINPNYNQGYDYAFSDSVRGRARNGLRGCTDTCCAPKYRALARISRNPTKTATASQEEADRVLLDEFLGDNLHKLRNMNEEERDEVLLQAKTRDLANKHGNHRYTYERPESPVGIWRADFPTTQEEIEDRKKIKEQERKSVEHRYAEAMRPGGAYKFRDE